MKAVFAIFLITAALEPAMTQEPQALSLEISEAGPKVEVRLVAHSPRAQKVKYTLEVSGKSTSRHRGSTTLKAGGSEVLSTVRTSKNEDWCARLTVEEEGRAPYEISRGSCA